MDAQQRLVTQQFGSNASLYAKSSTHNDAAALADLLELAAPQPADEALDIATGPGTVALLLAPHVRRVVALDLTQEMLDEARKRADVQGLTNFETVQGPAENLPFEDSSFDLVTVRTAPHHYSDIVKAVQEMVRVVKLGGRVLIVDTCSPEGADLAKELHEIEAMRDPSHVRNYAPSEWRAMLQESRLEITTELVRDHALGKRLYFKEWVERMRVDPQTQEELRRRFQNASAELKEIMQIGAVADDFSFTLPEITILAEKQPPGGTL